MIKFSGLIKFIELVTNQNKEIQTKLNKNKVTPLRIAFAKQS